MQGNIYGYIRVSSTDQNEDRQLLALRGKAVRFTNVTEKDDMAAAVKAFLQ